MNNSNESHLYQAYVSGDGLVEQNDYVEIAKVLKKELLKVEKGWIEIIPFNHKLIFLKAKDGTCDFVFRNLRENKFQSPYQKYIRHENIPSLLNEEYDFERWLYFGFKDKKNDIKKIKPLELWAELDEHLSEIDYYQNHKDQKYPGYKNILKNFYIKKGLYSYNYKNSKKILDEYEKVTLEDEVLYVSQLITIKDFFEFYEDDYKKKRSLDLEEIYSVKGTSKNYPIRDIKP